MPGQATEERAAIFAGVEQLEYLARRIAFDQRRRDDGAARTGRDKIENG